MRFTNRIIGFLLVAALSVLGGAQAGRAGAHDARAIEICAEDAVIIIHVDAEGRQVPAAPVCDCAACGHCTLPALALPPTAPGPMAAPRLARRMGAMPAPRVPAPVRPAARLARGPPAPKAMI